MQRFKDKTGYYKNRKKEIKKYLKALEKEYQQAVSNLFEQGGDL